MHLNGIFLIFFNTDDTFAINKFQGSRLNFDFQPRSLILEPYQYIKT